MRINKQSILFLHLNMLMLCSTPAFGDLIGRVSHERVYHLGVGISGEVDTVNAERGALVDKNAVLLTLHDAHLEAALKAAESALALADARLAEANRAFARDEELYVEGSLSLSELEESENNRKHLMHVRDFRVQALAEKKHDLRLSRILAPESGVILDRSSHPGERVNTDVDPGTLILFGAGVKILEVVMSEMEEPMPRAGESVSLTDMAGDIQPATIERLEISALEGVVRLYLDEPGRLPEYASHVTISQ